MLNDTMGKFHFWVTFLGTYAITIRCITWDSWACRAATTRWEQTVFMPESAQTLNQAITIAALIVGAVQVVFIWNLIWSYFHGKPAGGNPWRATTLEWQTPDTPPSTATSDPSSRSSIDGPMTTAAGRSEDFIPQNQPPGKKAPGLETTPDAADLGVLALKPQGGHS